MFQTYNSLTDVPESLREHYVMKSGRAVPEVSSDHPLVVNNTTVTDKLKDAERERDTAKTEAQTAKDALAAANVLPRGHKAVPTTDAELLDAIKAEGVTTADAFKTLKSEHGTFKTEAESAKAATHAASIGEAMKWDKDKTARLATKVYDFSTLSVREENGQKVVIAKVKQADDTFVEKPFADVVKTTPELSDLLPSLAVSSGGTRVPGSTGGAGSPPADEDMIEKRRKEKEAARQATPNPLMPQKPAGTAATA